MTDENDTVKVEEMANDVDDLGLDDNTPQTIQSLLEEKNRLRSDANDSVAKLLRKNKFDRGDIAKTFGRMKDYLDFVDSFQELILNDLQIIDGRFRRTEENLFKVSQQQTILLTTLKDKQMISDEEMITAWETKVKPELETRVAEMQAAATAQATAAAAPQTEVVTTATESAVLIPEVV